MSIVVMRIIARRPLRDFGGRHPIAAPSLSYWLNIASKAKWKSMNDVTLSFRNAKVLNGDRVRFEIAGGAYRLIVSFSFPGQACWIKFLGTHEDYDAVDALNISMF